MSGRLSGYVVRDDRPVAGATVTIIEAAGPHADFAPVSDENGWFVLDDLPAGWWRAKAIGPNGDSGEAVFEIRDATQSKVVFSLNPAKGVGAK